MNNENAKITYPLSRLFIKITNLVFIFKINFSHFLMQGFQTFQRLRKTQFAFLSLHKAQLDMGVLSSAQRGKIK